MRKILIVQNINEKGLNLLDQHPDYEFEVLEDINDPSLKDKINHSCITLILNVMQCWYYLHRQ